MPQEFNMQEAIRLAIQTEKDVMDFYNKAAALTKNERGRKVFAQLAKEEHEHAGHFFHIYPARIWAASKSSWPSRRGSSR